MQQRLYKTAVMVAHDLAATAAAVVLTFLFRFQGGMLDERLHALPLLLPPNQQRCVPNVYRHYHIVVFNYRDSGGEAEGEDLLHRQARVLRRLGKA